MGKNAFSVALKNSLRGVALAGGNEVDVICMPVLGLGFAVSMIWARTRGVLSHVLSIPCIALAFISQDSSI